MDSTIHKMAECPDCGNSHLAYCIDGNQNDPNDYLLVFHCRTDAQDDPCPGAGRSPVSLEDDTAYWNAELDHFQQNPPLPPDEDHVIGYWEGTEEGMKRMWAKLKGMSETELLKVWDNLGEYDPRNYYDKNAQIGMDTWAEAVRIEMDHRKIKYSW